MVHSIAFSLGVIGSIVVTLAVAVSAKRRPEPAGRWLSATMVLAAVWIGLVGLNAVVHVSELSMWLNAGTWTVAAIVPVGWLGFALAYTGNQRWLTLPVFVALALVPAVTVVLLGVEQLTEPELVRTSVSFADLEGLSLTDTALGPVGIIHLVYSFLVIALGAVLLVQMTITGRAPYRIQGSLLVVAALAPLIATILALADVQILSALDPTPFSYGVSGALLLIGMNWYRLLESVPVPTRIAHEAVLESLSSPLVVVNGAGNVVHANEEAENAFDEIDLRGATMADLPGLDPDNPSSVLTDQYVSVSDPNGHHREYRLTETPLTDHHGRGYGHVYLYQDMTAVRKREQRLSVLNRVLRHDIRNEMTVAMGHAETGIEAYPEARDVFEAIEHTARSVIETSETARQIEDLVDRAPAGESAGPISTVLADIETRIERRYPETQLSFTVELAEDVHVPIGVDAVLRNLVVNATQHNHNPEPTVAVTIRPYRDGWLSITVRDDGPGIPAEELDVFEEGQETPLEHASGLGLWLVHWLVVEYGGECDVLTDASGTELRIALPTAEAVDSAA